MSHSSYRRIAGSIIIILSSMVMWSDSRPTYYTSLDQKYRIIWTKLDVNSCFWDQYMCNTFRSRYILALDGSKAEELMKWNQTYYQNCREYKDFEGKVTIHPCNPSHFTRRFYANNCLKTANETGEFFIVSCSFCRAYLNKSVFFSVLKKLQTH